MQDAGGLHVEVERRDLGRSPDVGRTVLLRRGVEDVRLVQDRQELRQRAGVGEVDLAVLLEDRQVALAGAAHRADRVARRQVLGVEDREEARYAALDLDRVDHGGGVDTGLRAGVHDVVDLDGEYSARFTGQSRQRGDGACGGRCDGRRRGVRFRAGAASAQADQQQGDGCGGGRRNGERAPWANSASETTSCPAPTVLRGSG